MFNILSFIILLLSVAVMIFALTLAIKAGRRKKTAADEKERVLTPLRIFLIGFSVSAALLFLPIYYFDYFTDDTAIIRIIKTLLLSVHNTMRVFILDGDFDGIQNAMMNFERVSEPLGVAYSLYGAFVFVSAPILTAGFVLSFFKNFSAHLRYFLGKADSVYYLSDLNDRSVALAEDIRRQSGDKGTLIVFLGVGEGADSELVSRAKKLNCILLSESISEISLRPRLGSAERKLYFIAGSEDENLNAALTLVNSCRKSPVYNQKNTKFYVFATSEESELMLDSVDNGNMTLRRVDETRNLVFNTLIEKPVFESFTEIDGVKRVTSVVIGSGNYGSKIIKALCWCGQLPDYQIHVHVIDKEKEAKKRFTATAPELMAKSGVKEPGEPYYTITFHEEKDVHGSDLGDILQKIGDVNNIFVTLGEDKSNLSVALRARREMKKLSLRSLSSDTKIYAVVYSTLKNDIVKESGGLKCLGEEDYGIELIGDVRDTYSLKVIEQEELERAGLDIHLEWLEHDRKRIIKENKDTAEINEKIEKSRAAYDKYEYFRRASIATAVHISVLSRLEVVFTDKDSEGENEHNRWSAFMRSEGYTFDETNKNHIAKTHPNLKAYERLGKSIQQIDSIAGKVRANSNLNRIR